MFVTASSAFHSFFRRNETLMRTAAQSLVLVALVLKKMLTQTVFKRIPLTREVYFHVCERLLAVISQHELSHFSINYPRLA